MALHTPCRDCPFRVDRPAFIRAARGVEIWQSLVSGGRFPCHKTIDYDAAEDADPDDEDPWAGVTAASEFCAGALILMEKAWPDTGGAARNQWVRWMGRLGSGLDLSALDLDAPIPDSFEDWIEYLRQGER